MGERCTLRLITINPTKKQVSVRVNGKGRVLTFSSDLLDEASVGRLGQWYDSYAVVQMLRFEVNREPGEEKGTCRYKIEITSASNETIKDLRAEYVIAFKERYQEKVELPSSGNKTKTKWEKREDRMTSRGGHDIEFIPARGRTVFYSEPVETENEQEIDVGNNKPPKIVRNKNSVQGIFIQIYSGDKLLREVESKPGMKQIAEDFSERASS